MRVVIPSVMKAPRYWTCRVVVAMVVMIARVLADAAGDSSSFLCPADAPCELEMGVAFGDPWVRANRSDVKYFNVLGTPQLQPSEVVVMAAYGEVEVYASSGGKTPTYSEHDWGGGNVLRLPGWTVPQEGDTLMIMVNATAAAQYRVLAASNEDVLRLEDGLPVQMLQDEGEMRYFSIDVREKGLDLTISVDPFFGDPDMYVSLYEYPENMTYHVLPSKKNFTWQAVSFGSDVLQMQGDVLSEHCIPDVEANKSCTYAIGVLAGSNCSYSIQASLNSGWKHPKQLLLGKPQSSFLEHEKFDYYALLITKAPEEDPWETVVITVTPTDGGRQDVYVTTSQTREPGPTDYDVKGENWAGALTLMFSETAPGFCSDCTIYVGVFGYKEGAYSIVASQGLTNLQEGIPAQGTVGGGGAAGQFYEFYYPPGEEESLQVVVTALTGDPDLYVTVGGNSMPGPHNFHWVGGETGSDFVVILPTDPHFCQDCAYQMGVTSVSNSSYTISTFRGDYGPTLLVQDRPQAGHVPAGGMRYFVVIPRADLGIRRLTVSLTTLSGQADLYMTRAMNLTAIDPMDDSTFSWTSKGSTVDKIVVEGEASSFDDAYVIGVFGVMEASFSVVAFFSRGILLLQAGVPQKHALRNREQMAFGFLVDQDDEDVQLTVTPLGGNPSLYAGMGAVPLCSENEKGSTGGEDMVCRSWTWACTGGAHRTISISAANPCEVDGQISPVPVPTKSPEDGEGKNAAAGDDAGDDDDNDDNGGDGDGDDGGSVSHVTVSEDCAPSSFGVGMMFLTVAVHDGTAAVFTVMASLLGKHTTLVEDMPQHATTSPMIPCGGVQTDGGSGACSSRYETSSTMQEALFVCKVSAGSMMAETGFSLSLVPECDARSCGGATCPVGCPERPAKVYVKSCVEGACLAGDRYPSQGNADAEFEVSSTHSTIFLADASGTAGDGLLCNPNARGAGSCLYYIGVTAGGADEPKMRLTATISTPKGVSLVTPCLKEGMLPDGMIVMPASRLSSSGTKSYEVCTEGTIDFEVSVESCRGEMDLLVCDPSCPNVLPTPEENGYAYMANGVTSCTVRHTSKGTERPQCEAKESGDNVSLVVSAQQPGGDDQSDEGTTFFVGVAMRVGQRASDLQHVLRLKTIGEGGVPIAPELFAKAIPSAAGGDASRAVIEEGELTVEWGGAMLKTPKFSGKHSHEAEERDCGDFCTFEVYAVPTMLNREYSRTQCGLESVLSRFKTEVVYSWRGTAKVAGEIQRATLVGLRPGDHDVFVVASCDMLCMEALLRMQCSRSLGNARAPCKTQYAVFPPALMVSSTSSLTPRRSRGSSGGGSSSSRTHMLFVFMLVCACAAGVMFALTRRLSRPGNSVPQNAAQGGAAASLGWSWGGGRGFQAGGGFELTDLGREQTRTNDHDGTDEFFVGGGRRGDAETGPGYASLLAGQEGHGE